MQNTKQSTKQAMEAQFQATLAGAVESCLWSTVPTPADENMDLMEPADQYTITEQEMDKLRGTLAYYMSGWFMENYFTICLVTDENYTWGHVGHDFWLTSQGHEQASGTGAWVRQETHSRTVWTATVTLLACASMTRPHTSTSTPTTFRTSPPACSRTITNHPQTPPRSTP